MQITSFYNQTFTTLKLISINCWKKAF